LLCWAAVSRTAEGSASAPTVGLGFMARRPEPSPLSVLDPEPEPASGSLAVVSKLREIARTQVDLNGDGVLERQELVDYALLMKDAERDRHTTAEVQRWDRNGDGVVELSELFGKLSKQDPSERVKKAMKLVEERFRVADEDRSQYLNADEMHIFLHPELSPAALNLEAGLQLNHLNANGDAGVDIDELAAAYIGDPTFDEEYHRYEFRIHDVDHDGLLGLEEMRELVAGHRYTDYTIAEMVTALDENKDGRITLAEFDSDHNVLVSSPAMEDWLYFSSHDEL